MHKEAGRPFPTMSEDSVVDYMVMEAVALKVMQEDRDAENHQEAENWKKDSAGFDNIRERLEQK